MMDQSGCFCRILLLSLLSLLFLFNPGNALAWNYEASGGFGYGPELNNGYDNIGGIIDFAFLNKSIDQKLHFLLDTSAAYWHAEITPSNSTFIGAVSPAFRAYFTDPATSRYRPFLQLAAGPAYTSSETLGTREQGSHFLFQDRLGAGIEIGSPSQAVVVSLQFIHCSNAGLASPNEGFDFPFVGSIGYEF